MEIVKYGHIKPKEISCNSCGAILEYVPYDIKNFLDKECVICPVCGRKLLIKKDVIERSDICE